MDDPPVLEGFICPMCKSDLGDGEKLLSHFQEEHSEEQDLVKIFKDILGKAKKKILKQDTSFDYSRNSRQSSSYSLDTSSYYEPQDIGTITSHTMMFNEIRTGRIQRLSVPLNQLLIRLDKLLENIPSDPIKKKAHEQNIVPWVDGSAVSRCPECAGVFRLARRQHHCRTCGSVMCNDCSRFMTIHMARKVLDKPILEETMPSSGDNQLRLCVHCLRLLETREQKRESRNSKPIISQFYEKLAEHKRLADHNYTLFVKMCSSLNGGESTYTLQDGQILKVKLLRLAESIDILSGKMAVLGTKDTENPPQGPALRLQNNIRAAATGYLRNQLLNLPVLPTEEAFILLQKRRREKITARIQEEKKINARSIQQSNPSAPKPATSQPKNSGPDLNVSLGQGWVPENMKVNESEDPLIEQMNIIRNYIKEAKAAQKFDEVNSLEQNLQDLKKEFWRKQHLQDDYPNSRESSEAGSIKSYDDGRGSSDINTQQDHFR